MSRLYHRFFRFICSISLLMSAGNGLLGQKETNVQSGLASYYADRFHGRKTASGERFNMYDMTAAHRTLAFNTLIKVTNLTTNKSVILRVNDRGPFGNPKRIVDVSKAAATKLDMFKAGVIKVRLEQVTEEDEDKQDSPVAVFKNPTQSPTGGKAPGPPLATNWVTGNTYSIWGTLQYPKGFGLQVSAYTDAENARQDAKTLIDKNIKDVVIQVGWARNARIYRVLAGRYASRDKATQGIEQLKKAGFYAFIKKHFE